MNTKDLRILSNLRLNARMPLTTMSKRTNIPVSTLFDKIKIYEKDCIIKHTALIDFEKLGFVRANVQLRVDKAQKEKLKEYLMNCTNINSIFKVNNGYDFIFEGIFKSINDMEEFIEHIEFKFTILKRNENIILEDLRREFFLTHPEMLVG